MTARLLVLGCLAGIVHANAESHDRASANVFSESYDKAPEDESWFSRLWPRRQLSHYSWHDSRPDTWTTSISNIIQKIGDGNITSATQAFDAFKEPYCVAAAANGGADP